MYTAQRNSGTGENGQSSRKDRGGQVTGRRGQQDLAETEDMSSEHQIPSRTYLKQRVISYGYSYC